MDNINIAKVINKADCISAFYFDVSFSKRQGENNMKIFFYGLVFTLQLIIMPAMASDDHDGSRYFTNKSIKGMWGLSGNGTLYPPLVPEPTPFSNMGTTYFDGDGECQVKIFVNIAGNFLGSASSDTCSYSVNPDGTGSGIATFSDPGAPPSSSIEFVIVDHGQELRAIYSDPVVGGFIAKRQ